MAHTDAVGNSVNLPDYAGALFVIGAQAGKTPLLSMTGSMTQGGIVTGATFVMGNFLTLDAASEGDVVSETSSITAPASDIFAPAQQTNYIQIMLKRFALSYKAQAQGTLSGVAAVDMGTTKPATSSFQRDAFLLQMACNMEWSMLRGTGTEPATAATAGTTRGIITAVNADGSTEIDASNAALSKSLMEQLEVAILGQTNGMEMPVIFAGAYVVQRLHDLYGNPDTSMEIGGVSLQQLALPTLNRCGLTYSPYVPTSTLALVDVAKVRPVFMRKPGKPSAFFEELAKTGAADSEQFFTMFGVDYANADYHGTIINIATS